MGYVIFGILALIAIALITYVVRVVVPRNVRKNQINDAEMRGFSAGKSYDPTLHSFTDAYRNTHTTDYLSDAYDEGFQRGMAHCREINAIVKMNAEAFRK
jgi:hypothetical protein